MAGEIQVPHATGQTVYAVLRNSAGEVWNGAAFVAFAAADWASYDIALAEQGASGVYVGAMPAVAAGVYSAEARRRVGATPAQSDPVIATGPVATASLWLR